MILVAIGAFVAMEFVSYAMHRWVMHGRRGLVLHASHHAPPAGRWERNDAFPAAFAVVGVVMFALAAAGLFPGWAWWAAAGITAYGVAYLVVHELFIHRRAPVRVPETRYLRWLRESHRAHHTDGGEPYGMLLPVTLDRTRRDALRRDQRAADDDSLVRASTRPMRHRL